MLRGIEMKLKILSTGPSQGKDPLEREYIRDLGYVSL